MTTASKLVDEITGEVINLEYDNDDPLYCTGPVVTASFDMGFPSPRATGYNLPNMNGFEDMTRFWGERAVAWAGYVRPWDSAPYPAITWDKIKALTAPNRRPWLHFIEDGWDGWRRMQLRGDAVNAPLDRAYGPVIAATISWKATNGGAMESVDLKQFKISPSGASSGGVCIDETGLCFVDPCGPMFEEGYIAATTIVVNKGNVNTYPLISFVGSVTDPSIKNLTTGQEITLVGNIPANAVYVVDTLNHTVRENNDPNLNRLNAYDFTKSNWMHLAPGENLLGYYFSGSAAGACYMDVRDRWI